MDPIWTGAAGGLVAAGGMMSYAVRGRSSAVFGPSIYHGDRSRAVLSLTFDDGPSESTPELLEILAKHRVRATFFMCGRNVRRLPHIAREVADAGHEIGNHSDTHPRFDFKSSEFIYQELARAQESIREHTGAAPHLFRAPYGVRWFGLKDAQARLGLTGVMWTVIGSDWKWPGGRVARKLTGGAANGGILCLHDGRGVRAAPDIRATLDAVDTAVPLLQDRGFQFETVSEMLCLTNSPRALRA
ncbi:MAG TPA: polysaccharide deacetylase family protein [Bryobacteraceae bacterium]|jgi:peptidoglycan/xylan/chitin deacetylase (PgdA/CDA1 family)